jgi:hypothetical protein
VLVKRSDPTLWAPVPYRDLTAGLRERMESNLTAVEQGLAQLGHEQDTKLTWSLSGHGHVVDSMRRAIDRTRERLAAAIPSDQLEELTPAMGAGRGARRRRGDRAGRPRPGPARGHVDPSPPEDAIDEPALQQQLLQVLAVVAAPLHLPPDADDLHQDDQVEHPDDLQEHAGDARADGAAEVLPIGDSGLDRLGGDRQAKCQTEDDAGVAQ